MHKWGGLEWLGDTEGYGQCYRSIERLFNFNRNYVAILYCFPDITSYSWKVANFYRATLC